jgi:hypothetical protein
MGPTTEISGLDSLQGLSTASRQVLGPIQPPLQWTPGVLSPEVKRQGSEADYPPPSTVEFKTAWSYTSTHPHIFTALLSIKLRNNFTFMTGLGTHLLRIHSWVHVEEQHRD